MRILLLSALSLISCTKNDEEMRLFVSSLNNQQTTPIISTLGVKMTSSNVAETYVYNDFLTGQLRQSVRCFRDNLTSNRTPNVLDYAAVYLDNLKIKTGVDDAAPYRMFSTTIGANHGYYRQLVTIVGHGKQWEDVGSIWNDGAEDRILYGIENDDQLWLNGSNFATNHTLTHVSGATNTGSFTTTSYLLLQFYPVTQNHSLELYVDGVLTPIADGDYKANTDIVFSESYDILRESSMNDWITANVGTLTGFQEFGGLPYVRVTTKARYTKFGNTLETDFLALEDVVPFKDIMFVMGYYLDESATFPNRRQYIPKALPFNQDGVDFDFANIEPTTYLPLANRVEITPDRAEATGIFCDRNLYLLDGLGFSMGFLPILDADPSVRRQRANQKAQEISTSGKIYMSAIDDDGKDDLLQGDYYKVISYKEFFESTTDRTAFYIVDDTQGGYYLYADWHNLPYNDSIEIPTELIGKNITLIEKSDNVSYTGTVLGSTLDVIIDATESYGYLILKL